MDVDMNSNTPLACNMDVFTTDERENHMQSTARLYQSVQDIRETKNGYEFVFPNDSEIITGLAEFISNERQCCPFLDFTLRVSPNVEPISLVLSGPEGTKEFLQAELQEAFV